MITENELRIANESYLQQDFYQLYPSILDLVKKITDRWDPSSSNESDPGVVILKLLAFMGDKLDYNTDKNILECFMPSATQEESMRKLCDMMGYEMHYYRSATTPVSFMWVGSKDVLDTTPTSGKTIRIPKFANITNTVAEESAVKAVNYILTKQVELSYAGQVESADAIEGQLVDFSINGDGIIRLSNITNNRLYFPEVKIAENGVWIFNLDDDNNIDESIDWIRTTNLNTAITTPDKHYWKFCFDSKRKVPYILFSDDIADIIKNGLRIKYVRTSGVNGNISAKTLDSITTKIYTTDHPEPEGYIVNSGDEQELIIQNVSFTQNGADVETLDDAYTNFKHTIGTFDTLVTCRDYANAIYQMVSSDSDNSNLVSNVQATDVRDDINFVNKIATFNKYGIVYEDVKVPVSSGESGSAAETISNFDVYIYPLNPIKSLYIARNYDNTFLPNYSNTYDIKTGLEEYKTLSHNICQVDNTFQKDFIYLIKNYYHLKAQIATTYKVSKYESEQIQNNISIALYQNFNARKLEYGEEIPYDSLLSVIQNADPRIKFVSLEEPKITTKVMTGDGETFDFNPTLNDEAGNGSRSRQLVAKNVLAGRLPLFNYDRRFNYTYGETNYGNDLRSQYGTEAGERAYYEGSGTTENCSITTITTQLEIPTDHLIAAEGYTLRANESIQLKAPNISTQLTYPISVNYRFAPNATTYPPIDADYKLTTGDKLYIEYTDTNDIEHKIVYLGGDNPTYTDSANPSQTISWSGIIRVNFDLQSKSETEAQKKVVFEGTQEIKLWTLINQEQIEIRKPVSINIKNTLLCYWTTNNANRLIFNAENPQSVTGEYHYSYTLDSDEYFFYTDNLKNSLVTLGSGTTLTLISTTELTEQDLQWKLPGSAQIDIDDIASQGIGAFSDTNWSVRKLTEDKFLEIQENQLIILGEGTNVKLTANSENLSEIDSDWQKLTNSEGFTYDGKPLAQFKNLEDTIYWEIRAILNINFGPDQSMELAEKTPEHQVNQIIMFMTSEWLDGGAVITNIAPDDDLFKYTEKIVDNAPIVTWDNSNFGRLRIKANYAIQKNGGKNIDVHRYSYSGNLQDDLQVYAFMASPAENLSSGTVTEIPLNTYLDNFTTIDFKAAESESGDSQQAILPVYIPDDSFGLIMIYYSGYSDGRQMTLSAINNLAEPVEGLDFYSDCYDAEAAEPSLDLLPDTPNIIRVEKGCTLVLSWDGFTSGSVTFSNIDIVKKTDSDLSGVNTDLLGLAENSGAQFIEELQNLRGCEMFYYNVPIDNSIHLDVKTLDEYSWFDYNNICNKFVLAQIDTNSLGNIEIAKSSRLGKW